MGLMHSDQRQPGSKVNRATIVSPTFAISDFPFGNSRTSSLPTGLLPPATVTPFSSSMHEGGSGRDHNVERTADQYQIVGRSEGEGARHRFRHRARRLHL